MKKIAKLPQKVWHLWAKALGEKAGKNDKESDFIAIIRTLIFISYFATNIFICAGVIRHWNDNEQQRRETISLSRS